MFFYNSNLHLQFFENSNIPLNCFFFLNIQFLKTSASKIACTVLNHVLLDINEIKLTYRRC